MAYRIVNCRWESGEHYRMLVNTTTGVPPYWPTLFISTQIRNTGRSVATMEAALDAIRVLFGFLDERRIDLEERVLQGEYFVTGEIDALCDQARLASRGERTVSPSLHYKRLTTLARYLEWFAHTLLGAEHAQYDYSPIERMVRNVQSRRPPWNDDATIKDRAPEDDVVARLLELTKPGHPENPFKDERTAQRNWLIILLLIELGLRKGELLGVKIPDIEWSRHELAIHRRADDPHDPRKRQPKAKALARRLPLSPRLTEAISDYVMGARRSTKRANTHRYLLVVHRRGPHEGQPLTLIGLDKVFEKLRDCDPLLKSLHPHALRHYWNWAFSNHLDSLPEKQRPEPEDEARIRSQMMGWVEGSRSARRYNLRHIRRKAAQATAALSEELTTEHPAQV